MKTFSRYAAALSVALIAFPAAAASQATQSVTAQCTTDATGGNGVRHSCASEPTVIMAPPGFVFIKDGPKGLSGGKTSANGSEHECRYEWNDFTEVVPGTGITQPRSFSLRAHARSPRGHFSGRGWAVCKFELTLTSFQQQ